MTDLATLCIAVDSTGVTNADKSMQALGKTGKWLEGIIKVTMAALAAEKLAEFIKNTATLAARYETLGVVLGVVGNNAGYTSQQMENYAKALQATGISMVESRNTLAVMAQAHIDLAKATELGRLAQDAAVIGNINSSEAFQQMIYGIQSGQTDVLRTIGINVNFEQSYAALAKTLGTTTKDLNENEKATARMNAVLAKAPALAGAYEASMGTAGKQLLSMKRYGEDLQVVLGGLFSDAFRESVYAVNQGLIDTKKWLQDNSEEAERANENLGLVAKNLIGIGKDLSNIFGTDGKSNWMSGTTDVLAMVSAHVRDLTKDLSGLVKMFGNMDAVVGEGVDVVFEKLTGTRFFGNNDAGLKEFRKGWNAINSDNADYWNLRRKAGVPGNITETGPVGMGLINQELAKIKAAGLASGGGAGGTRAGRPSKASAIDFYQEQDSMNAELAWEQDWLNKRDETWLKASEQRRKADSQAFDQRQQSLQDMNSAYQTSMQIITPYWAQIQGIAQSETVLNQALRDGTITMEAYLVGMQNLQNSAPVITEAFGDLRNTIQDFSYQATDYLVDFCFTGKSSFSDLINSMLRDLARLTMQQNVTTPLAGWLGTLIGGFVGSSTGYQGTSSFLTALGSLIVAPRASGGPVYGGAPYLVGESGPELYVPRQSGTIVPNNKLGGGGNVSVVNNISINRDGNVDVQTDAKTMPALGNLIAAKTRETIMTEMRAGGLLA